MKKNVLKNQLKIVIFTAVKNRCILHGRVFVMVYNLHVGICCTSGKCMHVLNSLLFLEVIIFKIDQYHYLKQI